MLVDQYDTNKPTKTNPQYDTQNSNYLHLIICIQKKEEEEEKKWWFIYLENDNDKDKFIQLFIKYLLS